MITFNLSFYHKGQVLFFFCRPFQPSVSPHIYLKSAWAHTFDLILYFVVLAFGVATTFLRYSMWRKNMRWPVMAFDALSILIAIKVVLVHFFSQVTNRHLSLLYNDNWIKYAILLTFILEFAEQRIDYRKTFLNPAQLFIVSILAIILMGAVLLTLSPRPPMRASLFWTLYLPLPAQFVLRGSSLWIQGVILRSWAR